MQKEKISKEEMADRQMVKQIVGTLSKYGLLKEAEDLGLSSKALSSYFERILAVKRDIDEIKRRLDKFENEKGSKTQA